LKVFDPFLNVIRSQRPGYPFDFRLLLIGSSPPHQLNWIMILLS